MQALDIRPTTAADLPAITEIYEHAVRYGTATFELIPPDLAEMTRRFGVLMDGGFPYFAATLEGRVVGYAYAGAYRPRPAYRFTVENSVYLQPAIHRRGVGLQLLQRLIAECEARGYRQMIAVIGDSANAGSIGVHTQMRISDDRDPSRCRLQIRPLARHRDDAARAGRWRHDAAGASCQSGCARACGRRGSPSRIGNLDSDPALRGPECGYTTASLRSITSSTRSSSWPRRRISPLAEITL